ncbi:Uncharacterised protein [Legionella beliardensis]|uniref:Uncharacterized protein n=1 Tax=Legionella beliardensis TaxID=91822 RepID=A0A378I2B4_9GAMM|nr:leucine-rich repeat domain-containing protein [Legionella beliardensis]STX28841.1 Uncharacterised protein [Legionella beliardensis]
MKLSEDGKILLEVENKDIKPDGSFDFPDSVTAIADMAFEDCTSLKTINPPVRITSIGGFAFRNCINLQCVTLSEGITQIETATFVNCTSLETLILANSVTAIKEGACHNCTRLKSLILPEQLTEIDKYAFDTCQSLEAVFISPAIKVIDYCAFYDCSKSIKIFTHNDPAAIAHVKSLLPYFLMSKVISIAEADENFRTHCKQLTGKAPILQTNSPHLFFNGNASNSAQVNQEVKTPESTFDERPNHGVFP